jgi:hypothetical protein
MAKSTLAKIEFDCGETDVLPQGYGLVLEPARSAPRDQPEPNEAKLSFSFCASGSTIRVIGSGFWTAAYVDDHFDQLEICLVDVRRRLGRAKVLVDLRKSPVQAPDVADRIRIRAQQLYGAGDRVAVVVETSLLKMQLRRATDGQKIQNFISIAAAEMWLAAYD